MNKVDQYLAKYSKYLEVQDKVDPTKPRIPHNQPLFNKLTNIGEDLKSIKQSMSEAEKTALLQKLTVIHDNAVVEARRKNPNFPHGN